MSIQTVREVKSVVIRSELNPNGKVWGDKECENQHCRSKDKIIEVNTPHPIYRLWVSNVISRTMHFHDMACFREAMPAWVPPLKDAARRP